MKRVLLLVLALAGACGTPSPKPTAAALNPANKSDIRLCLSQDSPKLALGAAIRHRYYTERLPLFKRVHLMPPDGHTSMCDVIARLKSDDTDAGTDDVVVV